jgi:hypothetical protein
MFLVVGAGEKGERPLLLVSYCPVSEIAGISLGAIFYARDCYALIPGWALHLASISVIFNTRSFFLGG